MLETLMECIFDKIVSSRTFENFPEAKGRDSSLIPLKWKALSNLGTKNVWDGVYF